MYKPKFVTEEELIQFWNTLKINMIVWDELTNTYSKIINITTDNHDNKGIWLDSTYLCGGRYPYEVSPVEAQVCLMKNKKNC